MSNETSTKNTVWQQLTVLGRPLLSVGLVRDHDRNAAGAQRVAVEQGLGKLLGKGENVLDFLWSDVLTLRQFEDVL